MILEVENVSVQFDDFAAVDDVSFAMHTGEVSCLLGPSGCGKTTLLRAIAGFAPIQAGRIILAGVEVSNTKNILAPEQRNIGMVFQDFALFPHLTVFDNISFGIQDLPKSAQRKRVKEMLEMLGMSGFGTRYPHELSGGQQQRIALARALAPRPKLLLMDEPFSSMDGELRHALAIEIREVLKTEGITALMVTHDQGEAFSMSDNIGVMNQGKLLQWDEAYALYHEPASSFVADFIGEGVLIPGIVMDDLNIKTSLMTLEGKVPEGCKPSCTVQVLIRPDDIVHDDCSPMTATIKDKWFRGSNYLYALEMPDGTELLSMVHSHHNHAIGEKLGIVLELEHLVVFPAPHRE